MTNFHLEYSGSEAVEISKEIFKSNYDNEISAAKETLLRISRIYKKDLKASYLKYKNFGCSKGNAIIYFAALHLLLEEEKSSKNSISQQITNLQLEQDKYINNLEAVENTKEDESTKRTLRSHFARKRDELQTKINELINSFEVVDEVRLVIQTGLFD